MAYTNLPYNQISPLIVKIFKAFGFTEADAVCSADVILRADLYGIESHGIQRMIRYDDAIKSGMVKVDAVPETVWETPLSAVIDAHDAMGQTVSVDAMELAIKKAKTSGVGMVTVRTSNHYGIAAYYTKMAADADLIGICMTNSEAIMVPTNGKKAMLGTNPIAVSMPADPTPFLFDSATTVVPRGKLEVYNKKELPIPDCWAVDTEGKSSSNAAEILKNIIGKKGGGLLPLGGEEELTGGHKGYGFGLICELCTSILAGGPPSHKTYINLPKADTSQCFFAIDYGLFGNKTEIKKNFSELLEDLRNSPKKTGSTRIYIHGEKQLESYAELMVKGIPANEKTRAELRNISASLGIDTSFCPCIAE